MRVNYFSEWDGNEKGEKRQCLYAKSASAVLGPNTSVKTALWVLKRIKLKSNLWPKSVRSVKLLMEEVEEVGNTATYDFLFFFLNPIFVE